MFFELRFAAFDAVLYGGDRRPVDDHHVAFVVQAVANVFTGQLARLGVIGGDGGVGPFGGDVNRHHHDPGLFGPLHRRANAFRIGGVEDDHIDFGGDKVIDLRHLLAQIVAAGDQRHFDIISRQLAGLQLRPFGDLHKERVGKVAHRHANRFQLFGRRKRGGGQQRASTQRGDYRF